jgi:hypothetical protein
MALFTLNFTKQIADNFIESVASNNEILYVFGGGGISWENENDPPLENASVESLLDVRNNILFGKRITSSEISPVIFRNTWAPNNVYEMYDHRDENLPQKQYFIINSFNNVYKCLFNNNNSISTVEPNFLAEESAELSDGYVWKYMYTVDSGADTNFGTNNYIPVTPNTQVIEAAVSGAIDVIKVENGGENYIVFNTGFVQNATAPNILRIENTAQNSNNFYTDSGFYIAQGTGASSLRTITSYIANNSGKFVILDSPITADITSSYVISPKIDIFGDGSGATAYSLIDTDTNKLQEIKVITTGSNYTFAEVNITSNSFFSSGAVAAAIIPPIGGHGSSPEFELNSDSVAISVSINGSEVNRIPVDLEFRQFGILANPKSIANTELAYDDVFFNQLVSFTHSLSGISPFTVGELVEGSNGSIAKIITSTTASSRALVLKGTFVNDIDIVGRDSQIIGKINNVSSSDIDKYSGKILYYDNVTPLLRTQTASESLKIIIKF